jgi:predicted RND superfamily exporter protein
MFDRVATLVLKSPVPVAASILATVLLVGAVALPPAIEGDLMRLIPDEHPAVRALAAHRAEPGGEDALALTLPADADIEEVAERVEKLESVRSTFHGFTSELGLKLAILQLSPEQIEKLAEDIHAAIAFRNAGLIDKPDIDTSLFPWAVDPLPEPAKESDEEAASQILFVFPTAPPVDPDLALRLLEDLEQIVPEATFIAGPHADIGTAVREVRQDFRNTSLFSLLLVATIAALALRNIAGLLILVPPLLLANVLAISAVSLIFGSLNLYTSMGGALVFGLGIDFGIHLVARFREELGNGLDPPEAVRAAWCMTGPPCLTAALTSAAGFLVFLVAEFEGMRQLGVLLALGVILSLAMMLLVLPMLLTRIPLSDRATGRRPPKGRRSWPWTMAVVVLLSAVLIPAIPNLQFEYDISAIKSEGLAWDELTPEEQGYRQNAFPPVYIRTDDRTGLHEHFAERIDRGDFEHVRGVVSLDSVLPPDQEQRLAAMASLVKSANHPRRVYLRPSMRETLERLGDLDTEPIRPEDLPDGLAQLVGARGNQVLLLLEGNMLDLRVAEALSRELDEYKDEAASAFFVEAALGKVISADLPRVAGLALLIVLLIIVFDLRKPGLVTIATASLLLGITWAAASLALFGVRINIVNVVAMPMLLGIGIDIVVHLLHRLRSGSSVGETLRNTGVAVFFSTMTTIAAFVSLTAAQHRGLQSIGLVILIGLSAVLMATVLIITTSWPLVSKSGRASGSAR